MTEVAEIFFESIDSTNTWAHENVHELDPKKITCVVAEEQTKGRGRELRNWTSPKGNLYCTFCFQLPEGTENIPSLGQLISYSCSLVLQKHKLDPKIKWPNDVLISGKKIAGILCETIFEKNDIQVFLGIGVNINMEEKTLSEIDRPATSLRHELGKTFGVKEFYEELRDQFVKDLTLFQTKNFAPFQNPIQNLLAYRGQCIHVTDGKREYRGICHSITCEGLLNIELDSGEMMALHSGELSFIKN